MEDLSGRIVRDYELEECIGAGSFGAVYRARQPAVDREVAVKVILPEYADHPEFRSKFEAEAKMVARLEHPYIIPLYEYWRDENGAFLVMRWLKGGSLRDWLDSGPLELAVLDRLLEQIGGALAFSHEHGVIHRDLKPENILLDEAKNAYLTDFGIAKDLSRSGATEPGKITGSLDYLSPEQARGEPITPQTDIYALGVVLYELLTCEHPFPDSSPIQMIQKQLNDPIPSVAEKRPDLPTWVDEIISRATAKAPEDRYPNARAFLSDFSQAMVGPQERRAEFVELQPPAFIAGVEEELDIETPIFIGRARELTSLDNLLEKAHTENGQMAFVIGGPGRGKTSLLRRFANHAMESRHDVLVARGRCNSFSGIGDPYLPFREVLEMLTGDVEAAWSAGRITTSHAERLWSSFPMVVRYLLELGPNLLDAFISSEGLITRTQAAGTEGASLFNQLQNEVSHQRQISDNLKQTHLFEQFTNVLHSLSEDNPLMLLLDDLQWMDSESISLLFHIGRRLKDSRILIVGAYRPEEIASGRNEDKHPLEKVLIEFKRQFGDVWIDLGQVEEAEARDFVDGLLETEPNRLGEDFRDSLFRHTGGHPLFTIELLRAMQDQKTLVQDNGDWVDDPLLEWDALPARIEAVIEDRVGRLDDECREILSIASVEGEDFTAQVVARIQGIDERRLLGLLSRELGKRNRLVIEQEALSLGQQQVSRFRFTHALFQRYIYASLTHGERTLLHREIGVTLEELCDGQSKESCVNLLAYHFENSDDEEKKRHYLLKAGEAAQKDYANSVAIDYYEKVLPLTPLAERSSVLIKLGKVRATIGENESAATCFRQAIAVAHDLADMESQAQCELAMAGLQRLQGLLQEASDLLAQSKTHFEAVDDQAGVGDCIRMLGIITDQHGDPDKARKLMLESLEIYRTLGDKKKEADVIGDLGVVAGRQGNLEEARPLFEESLRLRRQLKDRWGIANMLNNLGNMLLNEGERSAAHSHLEEAVSVYRKLGDKWSLGNSLNNLGNVLRTAGNYAAANEMYRESLAIYEQIGDKWALAYLFEDLAWLEALQKHAHRALRLYTLGANLREQIDAPLTAYEADELEKVLAPIYEDLQEDEKARIVAESQSMDLDGAIAYALGDVQSELDSALHP